MSDTFNPRPSSGKGATKQYVRHHVVTATFTTEHYPSTPNGPEEWDGYWEVEDESGMIDMDQDTFETHYTSLAEWERDRDNAVIRRLVDTFDRYEVEERERGNLSRSLMWRFCREAVLAELATEDQGHE